MPAPDPKVVRMTRPDHCSMLVGLPMTREGFDASRALAGRGYAARFLGGWSQYKVQLVHNMRRLSSVAVSLGIRYEACANCARLHEFLADISRPIVILVSHTSDGEIEMDGSFIGQERILEAVPANFAGVFDICACEPNELATALVAAKPCCLIRFLPQKVDPISWLLYFEAVFRLLNTERYSYLKASEEVTVSLLRQARR